MRWNCLGTRLEWYAMAGISPANGTNAPIYKIEVTEQGLFRVFCQDGREAAFSTLLEAQNFCEAKDEAFWADVTGNKP